MPLILHYAPDNASLCVRLALEAAGIGYRTALVDRAARAQDGAAYRALNPHGLIPALETPDGPMFETAAILLWLSERPGGEGLMPRAGSPDRGAALSWLFWLSNSLHPRLRLLFYPERHTSAGGIADLAAATREGIRADLDALDRLAASRPAWLVPAARSAHVCYLCPMLRWLALYPHEAVGWFDLRLWPNLLEIAKVTEVTDWARAAAIAEGLGQSPFSMPSLPSPPEGSAT